MDLAFIGYIAMFLGFVAMPLFEGETSSTPLAPAPEDEPDPAQSEPEAPADALPDTIRNVFHGMTEFGSEEEVEAEPPADQGTEPDAEPTPEAPDTPDTPPMTEEVAPSFDPFAAAFPEGSSTDGSDAPATLSERLQALVNA